MVLSKKQHSDELKLRILKSVKNYTKFLKRFFFIKIYPLRFWAEVYRCLPPRGSLFGELFKSLKRVRSDVWQKADYDVSFFLFP